MLNVHLAVFPKCFMDELCILRSMSVFDWVELAATLEVEGLELYEGILPRDDPSYLEHVKRALEAKRLQMPMLCCSPDFTVCDAAQRRQEIERQKRWIRWTAFFGGRTCRVLSGQRYPDLSRQEGVRRVVECFHEVLEYAEQHHVILAMENHYKDNYWLYPEFAQKLDVFLEILERVPSPWLGVNYDPSNAYFAGEDPIKLLEATKHRLVSMHASDRRLLPGHTVEELSQAAPAENYPKIMVHGVIGEGLNDYDRIFSILNEVDFQGWVSIEDGVNGMEELRRSVVFLKDKIQCWTSKSPSTSKS